MANGFTGGGYALLDQLQSLGLYDVILPFLLVFTIVFAVLEKTKIFGTKDNKARSNINAVIAMVLGLLIINQFEIVDRLNLFLPKISLFLVIALMVLVLFGLFGAKVEEGFGSWIWILFAIVSLIAVYWALSPSYGLDFFVPYWVYDNIATIIVIAIVLIIIFTVAGGGKGQSDTFEKFGNNIDKMIGRSK